MGNWLTHVLHGTDVKLVCVNEHRDTRYNAYNPNYLNNKFIQRIISRPSLLPNKMIDEIDHGGMVWFRH